MIIDIHTHLMMQGKGEPDPVAAMLDDAASAGVSFAVGSCIFPEPPEGDLNFPSSAVVRRMNRYAAEQCRLHARRLGFMGYINPQNPDWQKEMELCIAGGCCGIKLWVSLKDSRGSLDNTAEVLRCAAQKKQVVYLHVFNRTGGNSPGEITMEEFAALSRAVPDCRMIAGHTGGNWRRSAHAAKCCSGNVWMEIGGSNPDHGMVDGILKFCPPERLLYGSDAPGRTFPSQIWKVKESSLSAGQQELVLWKNALELLQLAPPAPLEEVKFPEKCAPETDHFCFCGHYPYEPRPEVSPEKLNALLENAGIRSGCAADLNAVFAPDPQKANRLFLEQCRTLPHILPLAVVNPAGAWRAVLEDAARMPEWFGLWLSPALHEWHLNAPEYQEFLRQCAAAGKPVFLNFGVYEPRFSMPEMKFTEISPAELNEFLSHLPFEKCIIQNRIPDAGVVYDPRILWCNTRLTDFGGVRKMITQQAEPPQIVHGSEFPFRHLLEVWKVNTLL